MSVSTTSVEFKTTFGTLLCKFDKNKKRFRRYCSKYLILCPSEKSHTGLKTTWGWEFSFEWRIILRQTFLFFVFPPHSFSNLLCCSSQVKDESLVIEWAVLPFLLSTMPEQNSLQAGLPSSGAHLHPHVWRERQPLDPPPFWACGLAVLCPGEGRHWVFHDPDI